MNSGMIKINNKMKNIIISIYLITIFNLSYSQNQSNSIAKIRYQEAEEAYEGGKFEIALKKLNEVEDLLGSSNSKVLYLKILIEDTIFKFQRRSCIPSFKYIEPIKTDLNFFIKNYYGASDQKLSEVLKINDYYDTIPADYIGYKKWFDNRLMSLNNEKKNMEIYLGHQRNYTKHYIDLIHNSYKKEESTGIKLFFGGTALLLPSMYYWSNIYGTDSDNEIKNGFAIFGTTFGGIGFIVSLFSLGTPNSEEEWARKVMPYALNHIKESRFRESQILHNINEINNKINNSKL